MATISGFSDIRGQRVKSSSLFQFNGCSGRNGKNRDLRQKDSSLNLVSYLWKTKIPTNSLITFWSPEIVPKLIDRSLYSSSLSQTETFDDIQRGRKWNPRIGPINHPLWPFEGLVVSWPEKARLICIEWAVDQAATTSTWGDQISPFKQNNHRQASKQSSRAKQGK